MNNLQELTSALEYAREQLYNAELRFDQVDPGEPELIDALVYEQKAWEKRCEFYRRKIREAMKDAKKIQS